MKYFIATVLTKGKKEEIPLYAKDKKEANDYAKLKNHGIILKVVESSEPLDVQFKKFKINFLKNIKKRKLKPDLLIGAIRHLSVMTNAGISIHDSITEVAKSTQDQNLKIVFKKIADDINSGHSLSASMENFKYELGSLTIAMVQLGEKTGNLDESLDSLADMLEEIRDNVTKFKKAMAYPRNVFVSISIAFIIMISYVVPKFKDMFEKLNSELPIPTQILLALENIINSYGIYILLISVISFLILKYLIDSNTNIRYTWHKLLLRIYLIKDIIKYSSLNRFTLVFSKLVGSGIPMAEALDTSISMIDNLYLRTKLASVRITVEKGGTLYKGMQETKLFENMIIQMVQAGEDSGKLDIMIEKVAKYFKMRFNTIIDGLAGSIEPIMLVVIASIVVLLALGIFLPMWDMNNAVLG